MSPSRRDLLKATPLLLATGIGGCSDTPAERSPPQSTPTDTVSSSTPTQSTPSHRCFEPEESSPLPVFKEAYGEVVLTNDDPEHRYCIWKVESETCFELNYEARVTEPDNSEVDVFALPADEGQKYLNKVHVDSEGDIRREIEKAQDKDIRIRNRIDSLSQERLSEPLYGSWFNTKSAILEPGEYWLVFDRTDIGTTQTSDYVSLQVSIWARNLVQEDVETGTQSVLEEFYTSLPEETNDVVEVLTDIAKEICNRISLGYGARELKEMGGAPVETYQATATVNAILDVVTERTSLNRSFLLEVTEDATAWTKRGAKVIPILGSVIEVFNIACDISEQNPEPTDDQVEELLLSLGILVAELALAQFGVVSKITRFTTSKMNQYLLGFLKDAVSLEFYIFLLREVYIIIYGSVTKAISKIKDMTDEIDDEETQFFSDEEQQTVDNITTKADLFDFEILDDTYTCTPE